MVEFGLDTFGTVPEGVPHAEVIRNVVAEGILADELGVDSFSVGEHHRREFAVSAPSIVQAALATATQRIKLGTAVTVLSSDDPIRVYEQTATIQAISQGRAEVTLGRGSFTESFPLFGYDLRDYEQLFAEKLDLFAALRSERRLQWSGTVRASVDAEIWPKTEQPFTTWVAVGGSPQSVVRAAEYRFPLMLAIIGGDPVRFSPYAELYREASGEGEALPIGTHSPGLVWEDNEEAIQLMLPVARRMRETIGRERGWGPSSEAQLRQELEQGASYTGEPEFVAQRIARTVRALGSQRFVLKYDNGLPHEVQMESIRLYATRVIPRVRELLAL